MQEAISVAHVLVRIQRSPRDRPSIRSTSSTMWRMSARCVASRGGCTARPTSPLSAAARASASSVSTSTSRSCSRRGPPPGPRRAASPSPARPARHGGEQRPRQQGAVTAAGGRGTSGRPARAAPGPGEVARAPADPGQVHACRRRDARSPPAVAAAMARAAWRPQPPVCPPGARRGRASSGAARPGRRSRAARTRPPLGTAGRAASSKRWSAWAMAPSMASACTSPHESPIGSRSSTAVVSGGRRPRRVAEHDRAERAEQQAGRPPPTPGPSVR